MKTRRAFLTSLVLAPAVLVAAKAAECAPTPTASMPEIPATPTASMPEIPATPFVASGCMLMPRKLSRRGLR